ncbi:hypothetical protein BKA65DRAFT_470978 [Rhexocercosporidium sp. MPI-PUGE-AT-0058]|nr:hypothetical protein BKA65DRAFT_470978 [Rhexocercosporidium sp. MPI-PUGE-AT-0058]
MSDVTEQKAKVYRGKKAAEMRKPGEWKKERPLTFLYRDERMKDLAALAKSYLDGHIGYEALMALVPKETSWLKNSEQFQRCEGKKDVLLVLGWCTKHDVPINLDEDPAKLCLTEQLVLCIEHITSKPVSFLDFFKECKRDSRDGGCEGSDRYVQENTIHSIALIVELTIGTREYGIEFCGVWGFAKLFQSFVDQAVFPKLPAMADLPPAYVGYHIGRISDIHQQKRRPLTLDLLESLGSVIGMEKRELYSSMRHWFEERKLDFQLPELDVERETKLGQKIDALFASVNQRHIKSVISSTFANSRSRPSDSSPLSFSSPSVSLPPTPSPLSQTWKPKPTLFEDVWVVELATRKRIAEEKALSLPEKKKRKTAGS